MQTYNLGAFTYVIIISQKNKQKTFAFVTNQPRMDGGGDGDKELHIKSRTHDLNQSN